MHYTLNQVNRHHQINISEPAAMVLIEANVTYGRELGLVAA